MCFQTAGAARVEALTARGAEGTWAAGAETTAAERTDVSPHRTRDDCMSHCLVHLTPDSSLMFLIFWKTCQISRSVLVVHVVNNNLISNWGNVGSNVHY